MTKKRERNLIGRKQKWRKECHYHLIFRLLGDIFTLGIRISAFFNLILSHLHIYIHFRKIVSRSRCSPRKLMMMALRNGKPKYTFFPSDFSFLFREGERESKPRHKIDKSSKKERTFHNFSRFVCVKSN